MQRCFSLLLVCLLLILPVSATVSGDTVVYVTLYGKKYHRGSCSYLRQSKIEMTIENAVKAGYTPCSRCRPGKWEGMPEKQESTPKNIKNKLPTIPDRLDRTLFVIMKLTIFSIPVLFIFWIFVLLHRRSVQERQEKQRHEAFLDDLRQEVAPYVGLSKNELASSCGMPEDTCLGEDGLPHTKNSDVDLWTVYISRTGNCFHSKKDCCGRKLYAVNFVQSLDYYQLPCFQCWNQFIPDIAWYRHYLDILRKLRTLNLSPTD